MATRRLPRFVVNELAGLTYKITRVQRDRVSAPTRVNHTHTNSFVSTRPPSMDNPDHSCTQHAFPKMSHHSRARVAPAPTSSPGAANKQQEGESQQQGPHGSSQDIAHCIAAILHTLSYDPRRAELALTSRPENASDDEDGDGAESCDGDDEEGDGDGDDD